MSSQPKYKNFYVISCNKNLDITLIIRLKLWLYWDRISFLLKLISQSLPKKTVMFNHQTVFFFNVWPFFHVPWVKQSCRLQFSVAMTDEFYKKKPGLSLPRALVWWLKFYNQNLLFKNFELIITHCIKVQSCLDLDDFGWCFL